MSRLPPIVYEELSAKQKEVYDKIAASEGGVVGPYAIWLGMPDLCEAFKNLSDFLLNKSSLSQPFLQAVVLMIARKFNTPWLFGHHAKLAGKAGLSQKVIEDINHCRPLTFSDSKEQAVYEAVVVLLNREEIPDAIFDKCIELVGLDPMTEICNIMGQYMMYATVLNAFDLPPEEGAALLAAV